MLITFHSFERKMFCLFLWSKVCSRFPLKGFWLWMCHFQALRNTFQCNYWFKVWHYCEKTNENSEQILYTIINAMLSKNMI